MPYDSRSISKGGNQQFSREAPKGKFRIIGFDTFDNSEWVEGDFDSLLQAKKYADKKTKDKQTLKMYVFDAAVRLRYKAGTS